MSDLISREKLLNEINLLKKSPWYNKDFAAAKIVRKDAVTAVEMCIKEAPSVAEWISVKDRLPEPNTRVLVYAKQGCYINLRVDYICNGGIWFYSMMVTHWMPLPELPKETDVE